jgi:hypothetical protein
MAMPRGALKVAATPTPLAPPAVPLPASVLTALLARLMARMAWLFQSTTYSTPLVCQAAVVGKLKRALVPVASTLPVRPAELPAR